MHSATGDEVCVGAKVDVGAGVREEVGSGVGVATASSVGVRVGSGSVATRVGDGCGVKVGKNGVSVGSVVTDREDG